MMMNFLEALFGLDLWRREQPSIKTDMPQEMKKSTIIPLQFRDDVEKLRSYVGDENWYPGLEIELELKELLSICPRDRKRSDAYRKLIAYLKDDQQITLNIKTKKKQ